MAHFSAVDKMNSDRVLRRRIAVEHQRDREQIVNHIGSKLWGCQIIGICDDCLYLAQFTDGVADRAFRIRVDVPSLSIEELR